jgi:translation initiation factor 1
MSDVCETCGLPKELCVCESIAKETQKIEIALEEKKFHKVYTIIRGIDSRSVDIKVLARTLKEKLACGGTVKDDIIELQGSHIKDVKNVLVNAGFAPEMIIAKG